ncbi:MAG: AEC family transporter [Thiovulaceae bacterium]|nr:AEC family transporter [Sulfurimonadaceae bacterium]
MSSIIFSILGIYIFIVMGYLSKMSFKEKIDDKTITLINVYFLQVFLTFWGLLIRPVDITLLYAPSIYMFITLLILIVSAVVAKKIFYEQKEYSIATVSALIANTGNLGIPLCIAIFGEESIPYTTVINLMNVFVVYTVGVFYYSRGSFDVRTSLLNILKLPILWAALVAIVLSVAGYRPDGVILNTLMMGAYASMTMQLFLFGIYMHGAQIRLISKKLIAWVVAMKFLIVPAVTFAVLSFVDISQTLKGIIFIEMLMPLAVANVNLASLYDCQPKTVTVLTFITSLLFLGVIFVGVHLLEYL